MRLIGKTARALDEKWRGLLWLAMMAPSYRSSAQLIARSDSDEISSKTLKPAMTSSNSYPSSVRPPSDSLRTRRIAFAAMPARRCVQAVLQPFFELLWLGDWARRLSSSQRCRAVVCRCSRSRRAKTSRTAARSSCVRIKSDAVVVVGEAPVGSPSARAPIAGHRRLFGRCIAAKPASPAQTRTRTCRLPNTMATRPSKLSRRLATAGGWLAPRPPRPADAKPSACNPAPIAGR